MPEQLGIHRLQSFFTGSIVSFKKRSHSESVERTKRVGMTREENRYQPPWKGFSNSTSASTRFVQLPNSPWSFAWYFLPRSAMRPWRAADPLPRIMLRSPPGTTRVDRSRVGGAVLSVTFSYLT